jgi:hypothetical protein
MICQGSPPNLSSDFSDLKESDTFPKRQEAVRLLYQIYQNTDDSSFKNTLAQEI